MSTNYRASSITERTHFYAWCNREEITHVCTHCLAVVPDPTIGCHHCKRKAETKQQRLQAFLKSRGGEL